MEYNYNLIDDQEDNSDGAAYICHIFEFSTINGYVFILFTIISVIGNTLLIFVLVTQKDLKFVTKTFILNLACSDLIFTATLPFWAYYHLHHWVFGDFLCKFMTAVYFVGLYSSIFILTGMTVDRFITVVLNKWPNNSLRKRCAVGVCVAAWVISIAVSPYDASKMQVEDDSYCEAYSEAELGYYLQVSLLFFLPFAVIIFCHLSIIRTVFQATNRQRHKAVTVIFCIVAAYFICWGPYNSLLFIMSLYQPSGCKAAQWLETAYNICRILAFSHCCVNPLLCLLSQRIRRHLLDLLKVKTICLNKRQRVTDENGSGVQTVRLSTAVNSAVNLELHNQ